MFDVVIVRLSCISNNFFNWNNLKHIKMSGSFYCLFVFLMLPTFSVGRAIEQDVRTVLQGRDLVKMNIIDGVLITSLHLSFISEISTNETRVSWRHTDCMQNTNISSESCQISKQRLSIVVASMNTETKVSMPGVRFNSVYQLEVSPILLQGAVYDMSFTTPSCQSPDITLTICRDNDIPEPVLNTKHVVSFRNDLYIMISLCVLFTVIILVISVLLIHNKLKVRQLFGARLDSRNKSPPTERTVCIESREYPLFTPARHSSCKDVYAVKETTTPVILVWLLWYKCVVLCFLW